MPHPPEILLLASPDGAPSRWLRFAEPREVIAAHALADVLPALAAVEAAAAAGRWTAGFIAYEAGPAFDPALAAHPPGELPLLWWGVFDAPRPASPPAAPASPPAPLVWRPGLGRRRYRGAVEEVRRHIAAGDSYQVNYTFPLTARFAGDPAALFAALYHAQRGRYAAYLDLGRFAVCSASPELFFALDGERLLARPMKGTARRGRYAEEDDACRAALAASAKDRAENVMIVDMIRNDLGKVARPGSVRVEELFAVETYPTVHQLTSTVSARTRAPFTEVVRALFPCASITGAPKVRTSEIIRRLEVGPRGVYTGAVGFLAPGRRAQLNVAIRTAVVDRALRRARFGTGGGIVWDSRPAGEWDECRTKALVLTAGFPDFQLLETLRWQPRRGYSLLPRHLARLASSARYFGYPLDVDAVAARLAAAAAGFAPVRHRVRLLVDRDGGLEVAAEAWPCAGRTCWTVCLDDRPVDSRSPFLYHKTTHRRVYEEARARHPACQEVVLWNERDELTEATRANVVLNLDGVWLTPPVRCGLLAGAYRAELLARGRVREEVLPVAAFDRAEEVFLVNALRGWIRVRRVDGADRAHEKTPEPAAVAVAARQPSQEIR